MRKMRRGRNFFPEAAGSGLLPLERASRNGIDLRMKVKKLVKEGEKEKKR